MAALSKSGVERLVLLSYTFRKSMSHAMLEVSGNPDLATDAALSVLCSLALEGPQRPSMLRVLTGMTSGGLSKLLHRLESAGVVRRAYGVVPDDMRGALVTITARGRSMISGCAVTVAEWRVQLGAELNDLA